MPRRSICFCCIGRRGFQPGVAVLIVLTFVPFNVLHPVRVVRLRSLTLSLIAVWAVLAIFALASNFDVGAPVTDRALRDRRLYRRQRCRRSAV